MPYIESFLFYWLFALAGAVVLLSFLLTIIFLLKALYLLLKKQLSVKNLSFNVKKTVIVFIAIYLMATFVFYVERANNYLISDRPYKQAKSYAIAGEYLFLWQAGMLNIFHPDNAALVPINYLQNIILKNIRKHIPKDDAEYEIWNYKFNLIQYARTMYAPMTEESKEKGLSFTNAAASMKPKLLEILNSIFSSMEVLNDGTIKDTEFSKIDRYLVISSMLPYYKQYMLYQSNLNSNTKTNRRWFEDKVTKFWETKTTLKQYQKFLQIIDNIHEAMTKSAPLQKAFESHPRIKVSFYWGAVKGYVSYSYKQTHRGKYPCTNPNFLQYVKYYKEYVSWAYMTRGSSYNSLSKRERKKYDFMIEEVNNIPYYIAKYICEIPFEYMTKREKRIDPKYRKKAFSDSLERNSPVKKVRKIEKRLKLNKGEDDGR